MDVMRLILLVLIVDSGNSEVCQGEGAPTHRASSLLQQKSIKESSSLFALQEDNLILQPVLFASKTFQDLAGTRLDGDSTGWIHNLPCGVGMKLNASFSLDAKCPAECPLLADPTSKAKQEFCISKCVTADACASINPESPVADEKLGSCRGPVVSGCDEHAMDGTDTCLRCGAFRVLEHGRCPLKYQKTFYGALVFFFLLLLLLLLILRDLLMRPVTNEANLEDALNYRSKQKYRQPDHDGTGRHLYALSTNLCKTIIGGPGLALHFRFQAVLICWAGVIAASWVVLALLTDYDLLVLGTKEFGTAFRNCVLVAWGRSTQRRLMAVKESFVVLVYLCSFAGSILFGIQQLRFFQRLDEQNDTMKDYAVVILDLPPLDGNEPVEEELKDALERSTAQRVVGVSICWAYREHKDIIHVELMKQLHKQQGDSDTHIQQPAQEMGFFRQKLFNLEQMILSEGKEEVISEEALEQLVKSMRSSSMAFAVFETERARDQAVHLLSSGMTFREHALRVVAAHVEPHGVHWNNIDGTGNRGKVWRLMKGFMYIMLCLLLWMLIFYTPYAWAILEFNYEGGRQPGLIYTLAFSLIVCVGNLLMAEICSRVADAISFEFKDTRENCYMVLYLLAISINIGLDLWTTYFMATQIMVGLDFRTEDGTLLADVAGSFVKKFESYALQRSMGQQLIEYAFPSTFIVPFLAEPCAVIFLFSRIFMLLIGSHPELKVWECRSWLASIDLELGRYADCLVNVYLATMVFLFPGGYTQWIFIYLTISHIYIYAYDHYRVLRVVPRATFSSMKIDLCAQALLAPACGMLLVAIIFKGNCMSDTFCLDATEVLPLCLFAFLAHCVLHILLLSFFVPLFGDMAHGYRKDAKTFSQVAALEPCSWFSANPIHCLRSKFVFHHSPPCSYYMAGLESKMEVNESIGCFFKEKAESLEDVRSYYMPTWNDASKLWKQSKSLLFADDDAAMGDTGGSGSASSL